jgi:hypothetical protein
MRYLLTLNEHTEQEYGGRIWRERNARALAGVPAVALTQFSVKRHELYVN